MARATTVGAVAFDLNLNDSNYDKQLNNKIKSSENAFSSSFKKIGKFVVGAFAVKEVANFTKECISSASKVQSAFTGLNSIVQGTGNSFSQAQNFVKKYTADGLVSIEETATAYKNLLSRGYSTKQIEDTLNRLKDSAAFGRQASYDLGEAVVTATEGLKNENSILVDNAGVTKNVAKMWEEYAKSIGKSSTSLTQAEKIQAEYNGIMNETRFQIGDAAAYTKTFSGQIQQLKFNFNQMTVAIGKVITPLAQLFIPVINSTINTITKLFEKIQIIIGVFGLKMPDVVSKTASSVAKIGMNSKQSAKDAVSSAKKINKAFANIDEINVLKTKDSASTNNNATNEGVSSSESTSIGIVETPDNVISAAIENTIYKIRKYLEPLKNISFEPLTTAFNKLKKSLEPFGEKIGNGLSWLYFNILVPLAGFTIEDIIPSFLNILSGALNVLNEAIKDVKPLFEWLWNSILKPMLSWTGGVITDVLNSIGDALNWISRNETAMAILEGIGIAIGAIAGALALYNAAMVVCNIVTGAFSGIMAILTNPITLVVLAIGSLIATIVLCVKHWNEIKEAASKCWDKIKLIWEGVSNWFKSNIVEPVSNFFSGMWNGLKNGASNAWEGIKSVFSAVASFFKDVFTNAWEGVKKVFSTGGKIFDGIKEGIVKAFTAVVNVIIKGINKVVALPFKGLNGILQKIHDISFLGLTPFSWLKWRAPIPQIPLLAQGGYFKKNNPQLAIVGDNKREPEITTPESKIYDQTLKAIKDSETSNSSKEFKFIIEVRYEDGRKIIKKINQAQIEAGEVLLLV